MFQWVDGFGDKFSWQVGVIAERRIEQNGWGESHIHYE